MTSKTLERRLAELEEARRLVGEIDPARIEKMLVQLGRLQYRDAASLVRFHDALLFFKAFPANEKLLRRATNLLKTFPKRIADLRKHDADMSIFDDEKYSGVAGTSLCTDFHYDQVKWLVERFPASVAIDWEGYERTAALSAALPRFMPLLEEDSLVEADVPYLRWIKTASGGRDLSWLIAGYERLNLSLEEKAESFGALELPVCCEWGQSSASRTFGGRAVRAPFYHSQPLIQRRDISLANELARPPIKLRHLSREEGEKILNLCREATTVRYRELYGTTRGDPSQVVQASVGRGVEIFLWGLPSDRRMPLRAYQAGFTLKNGVPINYIEGIALFEWMEIGFNTFYAYRDGETAWIYSQVLRMFHQLLGVTCISVYPYQIGKDNDEAIQSGAFWFYRKLGFRPMRSDLAKLVAVEEKKIASTVGYRTPSRTLRRLAEGHVVFELPGTPIGEWDGFAMRNLGFRVQQHMHDKFQGDAVKMRNWGKVRLAKWLGVAIDDLSPREQKAFEDFGVVLGLVTNSDRWTGQEKTALREIIRAKAKAADALYCRRLVEHQRFRNAVRPLGLQSNLGKLLPRK